MVNLIFIGMVYETIVIVITSFLLILILKKYFVKRHKLTFILFMIFLNWLCAMIFSWLSKVLVLYSGIDYIAYNTMPDQETLQSYILIRIVDFRFSFIFVTIGILLSYILKVEVFEEGYKQAQRIFVFAFGIFTAIYSFFIYQRDNILLDVIAFLLVSLLMLMVYIPFMTRSLINYRSISNPTFKKAFLSLALMSLFLTLVFVNFLIDRILILFGDPGFTVFYFMAWSCGVVGIVCAYLGYIKPKSKEKKIQ